MAAEKKVAENKVVETKEVAENKAVEKKEKKYRIRVTTNPGFCGIDAGGVQFANGEAVIGEGTIVGWFKEHEGYEVTEVTE